ncbi:MAG TPA: tRNA 2-thiouridine(34) synthase MnmA [Candidatus Paceibacterota bacterium]|nr:tRNA 2-thiouridine(34) synthase MnmA [Candidatus Paceibacterota bacterium]
MASQTPVRKGKVYVGMSGGVDSSVSAALLLEQGYDVTGVFIKVWQPEWLEEQGGCSWREDRLDAMRVCVHLGIPFRTLDLEETYKREVVDYMVSEYRAGRTPNPDVMCNRHVKFGGFFDWAMEQGADFVATGHYAQIQESGSKNLELRMGKDAGKDQSYFLWTLTQRELSRTIFPVGGMEKAETRTLARRFGLPVADKRDSQGLCFIGRVDAKEFLSHYIEPQRGDVLDEQGRVIGWHDGAVFLTLGERHGFTVTAKSPEDKPYYVVGRDVARNTITVSHRLKDGELSAERREFSLEKTNWIGGPEAIPQPGKAYTARVRHLGELLPCQIEVVAARQSGQTGQAEIGFKEKTLVIAPGQSVVVYDGDTCIGGGIVV